MLFDINDVDSIRVINKFFADAKAKNETVGLTSGCFDLIHFQHFSFFIRCRRLCSHLIVGVDADEVVRAVKGPQRPIIADFQRALMVDALKPVSFTFIMSGIEDFGRAAELFSPDIIFRNDDFEGREEEIVGREHARRVVIIKDQKFCESTTEIIEIVTRKIA
jgi:D-beta-D-heptose 7-phosphate kinase/D-beta-D-heptose 1-phosphate adenosyltransferase